MTATLPAPLTPTSRLDHLFPALSPAQVARIAAEIRRATGHRQGATRLACERRPYAIEIDGGERVPARTVIPPLGARRAATSATPSA